MRSEQNMYEQQKNSRFKRIVFFIMILLVVLSVTGYQMTQKKSDSKGESGKVEQTIPDKGKMTSKKISDVDKKNMEVSLESLQKMYSDSKTRELRSDISNEEIEGFKSNFDKIQNADLKSQFESEYKRIVESRQ